MTTRSKELDAAHREAVLQLLDVFPLGIISVITEHETSVKENFGELAYNSTYAQLMKFVKPTRAYQQGHLRRKHEELIGWDDEETKKNLWYFSPEVIDHLIYDVLLATDQSPSSPVEL